MKWDDCLLAAFPEPEVAVAKQTVANIQFIGKEKVKRDVKRTETDNKQTEPDDQSIPLYSSLLSSIFQGKLIGIIN